MCTAAYVEPTKDHFQYEILINFHCPQYNLYTCAYLDHSGLSLHPKALQYWAFEEIFVALGWCVLLDRTSSSRSSGNGQLCYYNKGREGGGTGGYIRGQSPDHIINVLRLLVVYHRNYIGCCIVNTYCAYSKHLHLLEGSSGRIEWLCRWGLLASASPAKRERERQSISSYFDQVWQLLTPSELMNAQNKSPNAHNNSSLFTKAHNFHWNPLHRSTSLWAQFFITPSSPLQLATSCFWEVVTPAERALSFLNTSPISPTQITHYRHWAAWLFSHFSAFRQIHQDLVQIQCSALRRVQVRARVHVTKALPR